MIELSLVELESELSAVLPARNLMRRRRRHMSTSASFGSAANGNMTDQQNVNPQTVVNVGHLRSAGIKLSSFNQNNNANQQTATPLNFGIGL